MSLKTNFTTIKAILSFKNMDKKRLKKIEHSKAEPIKADYKINENAKALHPDFLKLKVCDAVDMNGKGKLITFENVFQDNNKPKPLPHFRAGQYISLKLTDGKSTFSRPYSICSDPKLASQGKYSIFVAKANAFGSDFILENLKPGYELIASSPQGQFYLEPLRDSKNIIAVAGGSGITPFLAMAHAINSGFEDFNLTIIYGCKNKENALFEKELNELKSDRVSFRFVYSDTQGFITAEVIRQTALEGGFTGGDGNSDPETESAGGDKSDYSLFICGPTALYNFMEGEITKLGLPSNRVRKEVLGVTKTVWENPDYPKEFKDKYFTLTIKQWDKTYTIPCCSNEPVLTAIEKAGIKAPSKCRSGECGWCRSFLKSGNVYVPKENDGRRFSDITNNFIHPCCSFALSDLELEVPGDVFTE